MLACDKVNFKPGAECTVKKMMNVGDFVDQCDLLRSMDRTHPHLSRWMCEDHHEMEEWSESDSDDAPRDPSDLREYAFLNDSQRAAVDAVARMPLNKPSIRFIFGPPGTGKTVTLCALIAYLTMERGTVLVCAPTNQAVDELMERYNVGRAEHFIGVRVGCERRVSNANQARFLQKMVRDRRGYYAPSQAPRNVDMREEIIENAPVVFSTIGALRALGRRKFRSVIIDEASMCTEPNLLYALSFATHECILSGDHLQLQPFCASPNAAMLGLGVSPLKRFLPCALPLKVQYRMHPDISRFIIERMYPQMVDAVSIPEDGKRMRFFDTRYKAVQIGSSFVNRYHATVAEHLVKILKSKSDMQENGTIAIVTPYAAQCEFLRTMIPDRSVSIMTADATQGKEFDAVIICTVRGSGEFVNSPNRFNVMITRAKKYLFVIGDAEMLHAHSGDVWAPFIDYCRKKKWWRALDEQK